MDKTSPLPFPKSTHLFTDVTRRMAFLFHLLSLTRGPLIESASESHSVLSDSLRPPQTIGHQAPLSVEFSRQENEWVAISFSRESSQSRDRTCVSCISCIGKRVLYHQHHLGSMYIWLSSAESACNAGDLGSMIPGLGRSHGRGNGSLLQDSFLVLNFLLEDSCFIILCWFLPYINMNQP